MRVCLPHCSHFSVSGGVGCGLPGPGSVCPVLPKPQNGTILLALTCWGPRKLGFGPLRISDPWGHSLDKPHHQKTPQGCLGHCLFWVCCPQAGPGRGPSCHGCVSLVLTLPTSSTGVSLLRISLVHLSLWFLILCVSLFVPLSPDLRTHCWPWFQRTQGLPVNLGSSLGQSPTSGACFCISKMRT